MTALTQALTVREFLWTWDEYVLKQRIRKHVEKEIRDAEAAQFRGFHYRQPAAVFETEAEGIAYVIPLKRAKVINAKKNLKATENALKRWLDRAAATQ